MNVEGEEIQEDDVRVGTDRDHQSLGRVCGHGDSPIKQVESADL
jgi:hypothetical protein